MFRRHARLIVGVVSWGGLGFYRGLNEYDRHYNKRMSYNTGRNLEPYLYSKKITTGILGCLLYLNPILFFIFIPKEIYRFEVNVRGLESEKASDRYNEL
jgi:hypothetical protein